MDEYINRREVLVELSRIFLDSRITKQNEDIWSDAVKAAITTVKEEPSVDVRPERHGRWVYQEPDDEYSWKPWLCSNCKMPGGKHQTDFCPHCGAKMYGSFKSYGWISTSEQLPPENQIVDTKIDDEKGLRNDCQLIFSNNLWWLPDKSMYIYYTPTHWKYSTKIGGENND